MCEGGGGLTLVLCYGNETGPVGVLDQPRPFPALSANVKITRNKHINGCHLVIGQLLSLFCYL